MMMSEQNQQSLRRKTRSASICAPGSSSMEQMLSAAGMPPPGKENRILAGARKDSGGSATPESSSTPTRTRRRPATRSQSARVTGANKSIRRARAAQQGEFGITNFFNKASMKRGKKFTDWILLSDSNPVGLYFHYWGFLRPRSAVLWFILADMADLFKILASYNFASIVWNIKEFHNLCIELLHLVTNSCKFT